MSSTAVRTTMKHWRERERIHSAIVIYNAVWKGNFGALQKVQQDQKRLTSSSGCSPQVKASEKAKREPSNELTGESRSAQGVIPQHTKHTYLSRRHGLTKSTLRSAQRVSPEF